MRKSDADNLKFKGNRLPS